MIRYLLAFARFVWHPIYQVTRPLVRRIIKFKVSKINNVDLISQQKILFQDIGLDWGSANRAVTEIVGDHTDLKSHRSQHYELFVAIAQLSLPRRILEIGTADASFTCFLARAFPDALIETIDLPVNDQRFWNATYDEPGNERASTPKNQIKSPYLKLRNENLRSSPKIVFHEMNSLELSRFDGDKYDLIWVDGDHTFPVVACDIGNAIRLLEPSGVMMCDDIYLSDGRKGKWGSQETQRALQAFTEAKIISTQYVLKSVLPQKNFNSKVQKHLAVCKVL